MSREEIIAALPALRGGSTDLAGFRPASPFYSRNNDQITKANQPTRTGNGASHSQEPAKDHRQRDGDHQESEKTP
jgi:hypothetical protein